MMLARSAKMATTAKAVVKRVSFKNDHPNLMKPRATDRFIFEKNGIIANFFHEKPEPVVERPRRLRFGSGRSLAEMAGESPKNRPRSVSVTIEEVDPERILRKKSPACPLYTPMTAYSNGRKMWEQTELTALNKAATSYYQLLRERSELVKGVYETPAGTRSSETAQKIAHITEKIAALKNEMNMRRQNLQTIGAF